MSAHHNYEIEIFIHGVREPTKFTITAQTALQAMEKAMVEIAGSPVYVEKLILERMPLKKLHAHERELLRMGYLAGVKDASDQWDSLSEDAKEAIFQQYLAENGYEPKETA